MNDLPWYSQREELKAVPENEGWPPASHTASRGGTVDEALGMLIDPAKPRQVLGAGEFRSVEAIGFVDEKPTLALKRFSEAGINQSRNKITNDLRKWESVGLRLGETPGVAKPIAMVIRLERDRQYEYQCIPTEPCTEAKACLRSLASNGADPRIAAVLMPLATGKPPRQIENLFPDDRKAIAQQGIGTLSAMHAQGIVHRDIKPSNMIYDPETKKTTLVDFGSSAKISNGSKLPFLSDRCGADVYRHPSMNMPDEARLYGPEVDLYSFAMSELKLSRRTRAAGDQLLRDLLISRSEFSGAYYLTERRAFKEHREKNPNGTYFRNLLVFTAQEFGFISARHAQCDLDAGDLELGFIEAALEVAMRKPDFSQTTRNARFADYYADLAELQKHEYLKG